ncbi:MAG: 3-hydroxyacyl-ACP dehydratase FabZ family protein [Maioricimonas sp. JB049]
MRWFWVDRFIEFDSGRSAKAIKNVTLAEEHLHDHFPGFPVMPGSLILEGMAQTGGILLGETRDFEHIVVLAKVPKVEYHSWACPGDTLTYEATLLDARDEGGMVSVTARCGERLVAEAEIMFAHLEQSAGGDIPAGASQKNFVFELGGLMGILDIGKAGDAPAAADTAD